MFCNRCLQVVCRCKPDRCTLCGHIIDEYPLWGVDYPNCGPIHDECGRYDDWHYFTNTKDVRIARFIREQGWLPTPCAVPIY